MGFILTIIVGGILGWLASKVMKTDAQQGIILNIIVGVVGARRWPASCCLRCSVFRRSTPPTSPSAVC